MARFSSNGFTCFSIISIFSTQVIPDELLWLLKKNGVTPDKTIVTSCNTGQLAGGAFFMLRYLGFDDVKVHDESWISWCADDE